MFGNSYGTGRSAFPIVYSVNQPPKSSNKKTPKKAPEKKSKPKKNVVLDAASLGPSIDGPPSPERIRAYTEQMKRSSIFGGNSRSNTFSSSTPSFRSRESSSTGNDNTLSRKSSARSTTKPNPYAMPDNSLWAERPESMQLFGNLFSRSGRKAKKDTGANSTVNIIEEEPGKEGAESSDSKSRKISTPYNFQHLTHTQQQHIPNLEKTTQTELVSEFSAIRASQVPSQGALKGIQADDLHFKNFSSESLGSPILEDVTPPPISPKNPQRKLSVRKQGPARLLGSKSQDNFLTNPPVRPPRSPSTFCPIDLPARTSSRTASILFDQFDPLATTTLDRPQTNGGFRRPAPFKIPSPTTVVPPAPTWNETDDYFNDRPMSHAMTTPGDEAWPLSASSVAFGVDLADVQEEEEPGSRLSKISYSSHELRGSLSVPALRLKSLEPEAPEEECDMPPSPDAYIVSAPRPVLPPTTFWDDIEYCYDNEIEANFDYQWDACDVNEDSERTPPAGPAPQLHLHLDKENQSVYHGRFRPLLTPGLSDTSEISPVSDPRTPVNFLRPASHASSFKESHGFNLSPSLLIPSDFRAQMDQESLHDEHFDFAASAVIFPSEGFPQSISPMDESIYSTSSYRSSAFSRGSARSSSSTRVSTVNSRASQDSVAMLGSGAGKAHNSVSSASSLPELIPSMLRNDPSSDSLVSLNVSISEDVSDTVPEALQHRRNKSMAGEPGFRRGVNHFAPVEAEAKNLSPVAETFLDSKDAVKEKPVAHTRKASVPLAGIDNAKFKIRARASTASSGVGKPRGGYGLFPQVI